MARASTRTQAHEIDVRARRLGRITVPIGCATVLAAAGADHLRKALATVCLGLCLVLAAAFLVVGYGSMRLYFRATKIRRLGYNADEERLRHLR
jgi:preprotein translocase subunit SecD